MARPKGSKNKKTLAQVAEKEAMREELRNRVAAKFGPLIDSQVDNALGLKYVVARNVKTGKFERVGEKGVEGILERQEKGEALEVIEVWEKDPNVHAFEYLLNQSIDQPARPKEVLEHEGEVVIKWKAE